MAKDKKTVSTVKRNADTFYDKFESWFLKNDKRVFYVLVATCVFLSLISFNARISEAHDDALYLEGGSRFVKGCF